MTYRRLFDLELRHEWFAGGPCPDLRIAPSPAGARALARHRLLARPRPSGLEVLAPLGPGDAPLIALDGLVLRLDVAAAGDFFDYSAPDTWPAGQLPVYRNEPDRSLSLHAAPRAPGLAAALEIGAVASAWLADPPAFRLTLPARSPYWVYYLFTARGGDLAPQIVDGDLQRGLSFQRDALTPELLAGDPLAARLAARHPGRRAHRFTSAQPIPCRRDPLRQLGLHLGDEQLVRDLPSPDIRHHAAHKVAPEGVPQDSLFRVLEY